MGEKMLSPKQINQYSENGFTVKRGMISKNDISKLLVDKFSESIEFSEDTNFIKVVNSKKWKMTSKRKI